MGDYENCKNLLAPILDTKVNTTFTAVHLSVSQRKKKNSNRSSICDDNSPFNIDNVLERDGRDNGSTKENVSSDKTNSVFKISVRPLNELLENENENLLTPLYKDALKQSIKCDDYVIISSDEDDKKNTPLNSKRKKTKQKPIAKEETLTQPSPSRKRKLTRRTNLKTFSEKDLDPSQKRINEFFKVKKNPNIISYFDTFEETKHPKESTYDIEKDTNSTKSGDLYFSMIVENVNTTTKQNVNTENNTSTNTSCHTINKCKKKKLNDLLLQENSSDNVNSEIQGETMKRMGRMGSTLVEDTESIDYPLQTTIFEPLYLKTSSRSRNRIISTSSTTSSVGNHNEINTSNRYNFRKRLNFRKDDKLATSSNNEVTSSGMGTSFETDNDQIAINTNIVDLTKENTPENRNPFKSLKIVIKTKSSSSSTKSKSGTSVKAKKPKKVISCPSYKKIEGTTFAVDAFRFGHIEGITHYFLTHFHADHYIGLTKKFNKPIYLSPITAKLVRTFIQTGEEYLHEIDIDETISINGINVTTIDANHCPGAVMFLFKFPDSDLCTLHTGDFRASILMEELPIFWNNQIHTVYLDTTYLSRKYNFKPQEESIKEAKECVKNFRAKHIGEKILIVCGTYVIGKEKIWMSIAEEENLKVWTEGSRKNSLEAMGDVNMLKHLVNHPNDAQLHVLPMNKLFYESLREYLESFSEQFEILLAIRPSGWEKNSRPQYRGKINIVGIEYSEHSSHDELRRFVRFLQPTNIISTVPEGSDYSKTTKMPSNWYCNSLRPIREEYQSSLTNFIEVTGNIREYGKPTEEMIELQKAKFYNSLDENLNMLDATQSQIYEEDNVSLKMTKSEGNEDEKKSQKAKVKKTMCSSNPDTDWMS